MTVSLWLFGVQVLAFSIGPTAEAETEGGELAGGTTSGQFLSFTASLENPEEVPFPQRCPTWDEPSE